MSRIKLPVVSMVHHSTDRCSHDAQLFTDNRQLVALHNNHRNSLSTRLVETDMRKGPTLSNSHHTRHSKADIVATNTVDGIVVDYARADASFDIIGSTTMTDIVAIVVNRTHFVQLKIRSAENLQQLDTITSYQREIAR